MHSSITTVPLPNQPKPLHMQRRLQRILRNNPYAGLHDQRSPTRESLENYIRKTFAQAYDADVNVFAPLLLELRCGGSISGVAGIRPAAGTDLFVEQYLDTSAEQYVSNVAAADIHRNEIVEVCNLAASRPGAHQIITLMLAASLSAAGYRYAILAGTVQLVKMLTKQNFAMLDLGPADSSRLGNEAHHWGSYYETCPRVLVVDLEQTMVTLRQQLLPAALLNIFATRTEALGVSLKLERSAVRPAATESEVV